jgi:outer membrane receptor protein involved in Fe transport
MVSSGDTAFQWIAGLFYRDVVREQIQSGGFKFAPGLIPQSLTRIDSQSYSIFGEASYGFMDDKVRVLAGARSFHDTRRTRVFVLGNLTGDIKPKFDSFNPRFNLTVKPNASAMIYLNVAKGYRSGLTNTPTQVQLAAIDGISGIEVVDPDSIWTSEVGAKFDMFSRSINVDVAVYQSKWNDIQLFSPTSAGISYNVNGGDATIKGVELAVTWLTPVEGLRLVASGSYTHAVFDEVNPRLRNPIFFPGADLPNIPHWSGNVSIDYIGPIGDGEWNLVAGGVFIFKDGQTDANANPGISTDQRSELSLRAGVVKDDIEVTLFANNIYDNRESISALGGAEWSSPMPRTIGMRVVKGF